ncbi:MAG: EVE domain-containing protein [Verrucomicrobiales bacterium]
MRHWLLKSEPDVFSFADLKKRPKKTEPWNGVRNYQARNYMRDDMEPGDLALFYHSSTAIPGIAGIARISRAAYPDPTQFDSASEYFDAKSDPENPRWVMVDVTWKADFPEFVTLETMKADPGLNGMLILRRGNRLSVTPVEAEHFDRICQLGCMVAS